MNQVLRFAPSPTGYLHVGGARTAIFNWLSARKSGGKFLLRIEDTDRERSTDESIQQILDSLKWLGIDWDDEVQYQSHREERHKEVVDELVAKGHAYRCFCSKNVLDGKRSLAQKEKQIYRYDGACRNLSEKEIQTKLEAGEPYSVRLKIPAGEVVFSDLVHGENRVQNETIDDFIILRSDGTPVYQLAVVVDDHDMGVTKVLRGDDHLSNTPKQILLYKSMGWEIPEFGHVPLILGPDKVRLSKRHGATSVEEFKKDGIFAESLFNFLCLLGWSPGDDTEIMTRDELIKRFDEERINKRSAVFDITKLYWMNGKYLSNMSVTEVLPEVERRLKKADIAIPGSDKERFDLLVELQKDRVRTISELMDSLCLYFEDPKEFDEKGVRKHFLKDGVLELMMSLNRELAESESTVYENTIEPENFIRNLADENNISAAKIIHPLRLALTGKTVSPGIFELVYILGKNKVLRRLEKAIGYIRQIQDE
ncbi:MAG: glutamate--tRNA ligase [Calditrichaceae bacterium]